MAWLIFTSVGIARADACWVMSGRVEDFATHKPLDATLFVKTADGRQRIGQSASATGQFSVPVDCGATVLIVERTGYRTQQLPLPKRPAGSEPQAVGVLIPLLILDKAELDRAYEQSVQRHYEQRTGNESSGQMQRGLFMITDALTQVPLSAEACLFSTNGQPKRCFTTDANGGFEARFEGRDIVAVEVKKPGYQPYQGNIVVEQLDGQVHRHPIRLVRALTLVSVQAESLEDGSQLTLRSNAGGSAVALTPVPGAAGFWAMYAVRPGRYALWRTDKASKSLKVSDVTVGEGLTVVQLPRTSPTPVPAKATKPKPTLAAAKPVTETKPRRVYRLPDELPQLYFDQGSYLLDDEDRDMLRQVGTFLRAHPEYRVKLIGHTDAEGDERMNRYLAEFRAKMIANFLFWEGIGSERVTVSGEGSRYTVAPSDTEENKAKNRRVFLKLEVIE